MSFGIYEGRCDPRAREISKATDGFLMMSVDEIHLNQMAMKFQ